MFTGLIREVGEVVSQGRNRLAVRTVRSNAKDGASIAVNGVCLTVTRKTSAGNASTLHFDLSAETLAKTSLKKLTTGAKVNIELALTMADSLGGHLVQGHVDGVGSVEKIVNQGSMKKFWFKAPRDIVKYIVPKGSVAVDGVSLTAVDVKPAGFSVAVVPFTLAHTNLKNLKPGNPVNLEADIIGKYVSAFLRKK